MVKGNIWQLAALALVLALVLPGANIAFGDAAKDYGANESATVDFDSNYTLSNDDVVQYESLTITNATGTTLVEGSDYWFNETTAEIEWLASENTSSGEEMAIGYAYEDHTQQTENNADILGTAGTWIGLLLAIAALGALLYIVFGGW
jgi:hypothetical protein